MAPPPKVIHNQDDEPPLLFRGRVTAINGEALTIKPEGNVRIRSRSFNPDGSVKVERIYHQDNTKPSRVFVFDDGLLYLNGTLPAERQTKRITLGSTFGKHKISDVQAGDIVSIRCNRIRDTDHCQTIEIWRRPGGRVPPAIGDDKLPADKRVDVGRNAEQEREEKVIQALQEFFFRLRP